MKKMQRLGWYIFFLFASTTVSAQNAKIDSLKSVLALSGKPDDFKVLWELAFESVDIDNAQAVIYARRSYYSALNKGDSLYIVKSARIMGQLLRRVDKLDEAVAIFLHALPIAERNNFDRERRILIRVLATTYTAKGNYDTALQYHLQSLIAMEESIDRNAIGEIFNNLGFIYYKLDNPDVAISYYEKSLASKFETKNFYDLDRLYVNIGLCYCQLSQHDKALDFFQKAAAICFKNCNDQIKIEVNFGMGTASRLSKKNYLAKLYFERSLNLSRIMSNQRFQLENLLELVELAFEKSDLNQTEKYLSQVELVPDRNNFPNIMMEFYRLSSELYQKRNDFSNANLFRIKYIELNQKLFDSKARNNFMKIQTQFVERENLKRIEAQSRVLALQNDSIRSQRWLNISLAVSFILAIGLVISLLRRVQQKQELNNFLDKQVEERTRELERNRDELQHAHNEQSLILRKVSSELIASLATMRGLSISGSLEICEGREMYYREAELMAQKIGAYVNNHLPSNQ